MSYKQLNLKGFAPVETILILVIVAMLGGIGYYVYQANKTADTTLTDAAESSQSSVDKQTAAAKHYFTVKEWGIRAPYDGNDSLTYRLSDNNDLATVMSKNVTAADASCTTSGAGQIVRLQPSDYVAPGGESGATVKQDAEQYPDRYAHVDDYYYRFQHDQAACGDTISIDIQNSANNVVQSLLFKFEAVPQP